MISAADPRRRRRLSTRTLSLRMAAASFAAAGAIFGGLAVQMANGHDPALGAGTGQTSAGSSGRSNQGFGTATGGQSGSQDRSGGSPSGVVTRAS